MIYPPLPKHRQSRTPVPSSSSTHHHSTSLALSGCPLSSCARASANHASDAFHALPSFVSPDSNPYARSRAARRSTSGRFCALYGVGSWSRSTAEDEVGLGVSLPRPMGRVGRTRPWVDLVFGERGFRVYEGRVPSRGGMDGGGRRSSV